MTLREQIKKYLSTLPSSTATSLAMQMERTPGEVEDELRQMTLKGEIRRQRKFRKPNQYSLWD